MRLTQNWRLNDARYTLTGERCPACGTAIFPPRDVCPACAAEAKIPHKLTGSGTIYSLTTLLEAPAGFEEQAPYTLALIQLDEGPLITAQLTDLDGPAQIGQRVEMVTRKLRSDGPHGVILYGYKFRPLLRPSPAP
ncbi:MAG: Zn-ribbon domain-containing OB-fold protein [Aggregatilineales bacterium]